MLSGGPISSAPISAWSGVAIAPTIYVTITESWSDVSYIDVQTEPRYIDAGTDRRYIDVQTESRYIDA